MLCLLTSAAAPAWTLSTALRFWPMWSLVMLRECMLLIKIPVTTVTKHVKPSPKDYILVIPRRLTLADRLVIIAQDFQ